MKRTARIFLCYARQDEVQIKALYDKLKLAGFDPWMDNVDLVGGEKWAVTIQRITPKSDFFIACLSKNSVNKRGFLQREIKIALDALQERLDEDIYIIPLRLEDCEVPESLTLFQWVDYFCEDGWNRLIKSIRKGMDRLGLIQKTTLRSQPQSLSENDMEEMLKKFDFYHTNKNPQGKSLQHCYELIEKRWLVLDHRTNLT